MTGPLRQSDGEIHAAAVAAAAVFAVRGWKWAGRPDEPDFVPTTADVERELWRLVGVASGLEGSGTIGTGRLVAEANDLGDIVLSIELGTLEEFVDRGEPDA